MSDFLAKLRSRMQKDSGLPLSVRLRENATAALKYASNAASAKVSLRNCNEVGSWARTAGGAPLIENLGRIEVGAHVLITSTFSRVHLSTGRNGTLKIGARTLVNFGTMISAHESVLIGSGVSFGPYCIVSDSAVENGGFADVAAAPIVIEDGVWLAGRVTVLPGTRIGAGSVVTAGSIVAGDIPPGVIAGGNPARVLRLIGNRGEAAPGWSAGTEPDVTNELGTLIAASAAQHGVEPASSHGNVTPAELPAGSAAAVPQRGPAAHTALIVSDFTVDGLAATLTEDTELPWVDAEAAPFGQVVPSLISLAHDDQLPDVVLVWTRPQLTSPAFQRVLAFEHVPESELLAEVDAFAKLIGENLRKCKCVVVPTWTLPTHNRGWGLMDTRRGGATRALCAMNLRLMEQLNAYSNVHVLNAQRWVETVGKLGQHPKLWYMGKVAFHDDAFAEAVRDIKAALVGVTSGPRKLIVVDLDDTLWGGIVGDQGWENLRLGGHDAVGEALVEFQHALRNLKRRGIVLAIASKNEESVALEAIRSHPEMVLREEDFVAWRINWRDKAANIVEIATELNLGLQSVVFLDDNPVERGRVREQLPEVLVPEWPEDQLLYASALQSLRCFDAPSITQEDAERTQMYVGERQRAALMPAEVGSMDDWVASLQLRVRATRLNASNAARAAQLLNKTNQLNLSTRRLTQSELEAWASDPNRDLLVVSVSDKYGDSGLTGIVSIEVQNDKARVVDYVLSCRVMGRKVEETMVYLAVECARRRGLTVVEAPHSPTPKNKPCLTFWQQRSGFENPEQNLFVWDASRPYVRPSPITLDFEG